MSTTSASPRSPAARSLDPSELERLQISDGEGVIGNVELERFRKEWKDVVRTKRTAGPGRARRKEDDRAAATPRPPDDARDGERKTSSPERRKVSPAKAPRPLSPDLGETQAGPSRRIPASSPPTRSHRSSRPHDKEQAVQVYARAVESEQSGKLNEALILYRRAFKMDGTSDVFGLS